MQLLKENLVCEFLLFDFKDILDDVRGAMDAGLLGGLVKTGKYLPEDEKKASISPTLVGLDFPCIVNDILLHRNES